MITSTDRQEELARELVDWEFNDKLPTQFAFDSFFGRMVVKGEEEKGFVVLVQPGGIFMDLKTGQKMEGDQWSFGFGDQGEGEGTVVVVEGERKIEVGPYELELVFNKTRGTRNGDTYWEVLGVFPGKRGPCIGALQLHESEWTDEAIEKAIQSIRLPGGREK